MHGSFMEELGFGGKESHMFFMEFPRMLEHVLRRSLEEKKKLHKSRRLSQGSNADK